MFFKKILGVYIKILSINLFNFFIFNIFFSISLKRKKTAKNYGKCLKIGKKTVEKL